MWQYFLNESQSWRNDETLKLAKFEVELPYELHFQPYFEIIA